jgi:hypothetical protein
LSGKGAKGTMGDKKGDKKKPTSRSSRAGLQFPVGRIHRLLKVRFKHTVGLPFVAVVGCDRRSTASLVSDRRFCFRLRGE